MQFTKAPSPVYGEAGVTLRYYTFDLLWHTLGRMVRFVWVIHFHPRPAGLALHRFNHGSLGDQLARQGFGLNDQFRGKNGRTPGTGKIFQTV
jgi:hypothetical protein